MRRRTSVSVSSSEEALQYCLRSRSPAEPFLTGIRIEVAIKVVDLSERRCVFVAQAQIDHQSRLDAPVILDEPGVLVPDHLADPVANADQSARGISGEEVFERAGRSATGWFDEPRDRAAQKIDLAPEVCVV